MRDCQVEDDAPPTADGAQAATLHDVLALSLSLLSPVRHAGAKRGDGSVIPRSLFVCVCLCAWRERDTALDTSRPSLSVAYTSSQQHTPPTLHQRQFNSFTKPCFFLNSTIPLTLKSDA